MVAFSDAVVAIAITVLILPLTDINLTDVKTQSVQEIYGRYGPQILGFAISWIVIIIFWMRHHRLFGLVGHIDSGLIWLNVAWLFGIAVFPFPADLVGQIGDGGSLDRFTASLYAGDLLFISVAGMLMSRHVGSHPELQNERGRSSSRYFRTTRAYFATAVFLVVLLAAQWLGMNALYFIWTLFLMEPICRMLDRKFYPADDQAGSSSR